jgi:hypothetical protein
LYRISLKLNTETFPDQNENHFENGFGFVYLLSNFFPSGQQNISQTKLKTNTEKFPGPFKNTSPPEGESAAPSVPKGG